MSSLGWVELNLGAEGVRRKAGADGMLLRYEDLMARPRPTMTSIAGLIGEEDRPTILAGDFNVSEEAELDLLAESSLQKATSTPTFPSWRPRRHLDHLFFSRHFSVRTTYAFDAFLFSDHLPFVAEVDLSPP